ncbi:20290_t:CDS:2, partial [Entrophospora sp. SA101]
DQNLTQVLKDDGELGRQIQEKKDILRQTSDRLGEEKLLKHTGISALSSDNNIFRYSKSSRVSSGVGGEQGLFISKLK